MAFKARVLIPAGAVVATVLAAACAPPPPPPPPPPPTTQPPAVCPATPKSAAGPDSQNPISSWGVNGTAVTTVVIGDIVYVGGTFSQAVSPTGTTKPHANLAAFCLANGNLLDTFQADLSGKAQNASSSTPQAWALTTDGTNLFVGGNFNAVNGTTTGPLAKLNPTTGAVQAWNPGPIPDIVYALDYFGGQVYAGGDFSINANLRKGVRFDAATGAVDPSWNANADAKIESLKVSPSGSWVYIGGAFQTVQGQPHDKLAKLARSSAAVQSVVYGNQAPGVVAARVFDIAIDPANESNVFVALGPKNGNPAPSGAGNRIVLFNSTGGATWDDNGPDGDGQAVDLIGSVLYAGFHGGWNGDTTKRLEGLNAANGGLTGFAPNTGGVLGVFDLAQAPASGRLVAVGDFSFMGSTTKLNGVAIFG